MAHFVNLATIMNPYKQALKIIMCRNIPVKLSKFWRLERGRGEEGKSQQHLV